MEDMQIKLIEPLKTELTQLKEALKETNERLAQFEFNSFRHNKDYETMKIGNVHAD